MKFIVENWLLIAIAFVSGALLVWPALVRRTAGGVVTHLQATQLMNGKGALLLDIRTSDDFARGHIAGAKNIPADQLSSRLAEIGKYKTGTVIVADAKGHKTSATAALLKKEGYAEVVSLEGGIEGWKNAGLPLTQ